MSRKSSDESKLVTAITVVSPSAPDTSSIQPGVEAVSIVRDLVTEVPNILSPEELARRVVELTKGTTLTAEVLDEKALEKGGFGGILGIGAGSSRPPRLVVVRYAPKGAKRHVALVGKGITFDTGGLSIKPAQSMVGMKYDMTGAATAFAVTRAVAQLEVPIAVTAWLCIAENMPSGTAIRPNDVVTIRGGKTVEVTNTDAEGRVVLADGLVAASEEFPDAIIDIATLTGAARVALGDRIAGVMGDESLTGIINRASSLAGEETWTMPLPEYLLPILASDVADIANAKVGNTAGGMLIGGTFLREFVGKSKTGEPIPWAHLDIAGPANNSASAYGFVPKGATGTMVRTLINTVIRLVDERKK
jgi:leucyl aminopeptidase